MSTVLSLLPMTRRNSNTARIRALRPTTTESIEIRAGVMTSSEEPQVLELRNLFAQRRLDPQIQRHVRARAAGAHARQPDVCRIPGDLDQLDVTAVRLHEWTNPLQHGLYAFFCHHARQQGNPCATGGAPETRKKWRILVRGRPRR